MAAQYSAVRRRLWREADFRALSDEEKLALLYLRTCSHQNLPGCFVLPLAYAADDLQWAAQTVGKRFRKLHDDGAIIWDPAVNLIFVPGARRQEVVDLQWADVHTGEKQFVRLLGKGNKERIVPLLPPAVNALGSPKDLGPVFVFHFRGYQRPHQVTGGAISHWFKEAARRAGLGEFHLHDLRHTAATYMVARGVDLKTVQAIMGHTSISTTMLYTHVLSRGHLYDEMSKLDFSLAGNRQAEDNGT